jgi:predicted transcriptional regulator
MSKVISTKIDDQTDEILGKMADELDVSKSWVVQQAIKQYLERYDTYLSDVRIASISETKSHNEVLKEYGL